MLTGGEAAADLKQLKRPTLNLWVPNNVGQSELDLLHFVYVTVEADPS
jgi:hypothetical protein